MRNWIAILICMTTLAAANNLDTLYEQAGKQYSQHKYEQALSTYQEIEMKLAAQGEKSFDLMYNMGCAYFRKGDLASARLYFERARRLNPRDESVNRNIQIVVSKLQDKIKVPPKGFIEQTYEMVTQLIPYHVLAGLLLLFLTSVFSFVALLISGRMRRKPLFYGLGVSLVLLLVTLMLLNSRAGELTRPEAVVFQPEIEIFSEPTTSSSLLFRLHTGTLVGIEDEHSGFYHVTLPDGMNGWSRKQNFKTVQ